ncbi:peflin-like [Eutrema salsugineum]|uniref:peflin-like n=1 Tax=Eutrema salsugineum TaxID=72664 RepID=UPI000CED08FB|nr:peflin-like [Eutrema salsugineum]
MCAFSIMVYERASMNQITVDHLVALLAKKVFDKDRSGRIDTNELRDALLKLGFSVSPVILDLLIEKFDRSGGRDRAIEYDNFITSRRSDRRYQAQLLSLTRPSCSLFYCFSLLECDSFIELISFTLQYVQTFYLT